jgi:hypothetical protein
MMPQHIEQNDQSVKAHIPSDDKSAKGQSTGRADTWVMYESDFPVNRVVAGSVQSAHARTTLLDNELSMAHIEAEEAGGRMGLLCDGFMTELFSVRDLSGWDEQKSDHAECKKVVDCCTPQRLCLMAGLLLASVAVAATIKFQDNAVSFPAVAPSNVLSQHGNNHEKTATGPENMSGTIADMMLAEISDSKSSLLLSKGGELFLEMMNQTDTMFTYFHVSREAKVEDSIPSSLLSNLILPQWSGHTVRPKKTL